MTAKDANYPAFPFVNPETGTLYDGLTKREYFAALAMQGLLSRKRTLYPAEVSAYAIEYADALLLQLETPQQ